MLLDTKLKEIFNKLAAEELVLKFCSFNSGQDEFYCQLGWLQAKATIGFIEAAQMLIERLSLTGISFAGEDPFEKESKPFSILEVILTKDGYEVTVVGKKSDRIVRKWTNRLSQWFQLPVTLTWEV